MGRVNTTARTTRASRRGGLCEADVRATYRVVLESLDFGYDPVGWRRRLLESLGQLVDADLCLSDVMPIDPSHNGTKIPLLVLHSAHPTGIVRMRAFMRGTNIVNDPLTPVIMSRWDRAETALVGQMIPRPSWLASAYVKRLYLAADIYDLIHSRMPLPESGQVSVLGLTRGKAQPRFTERERRIVEIAHQELAARIAVPSRATHDPYDSLPTRLQELATHLRGPMSEKQIAQEMRLSPHTVHNYAKSLYRRLGVTSRNEAQHAMRARDGRSGTRNELVLA